MKHSVNTVSVTLRKCVLRPELKLAIGSIQSILFKKNNFQLILKLDFLIKSYFIGLKYFWFLFSCKWLSFLEDNIFISKRLRLLQTWVSHLEQLEMRLEPCFCFVF